jgi:hypothetical protein
VVASCGLPARGGSAFLGGFMEIIPIELYGVHVETPFPAPVGLAAARLETFGARLCDPQQGLGIRPDQLRLKKWDELFGYELTGNFFGENGQVTRTCDRAKLFVRNARTAPDWKLIVQTLTRFYDILDPQEGSVTNLSAHVHAKFPGTDEREQWLQQFSHNALITRPGVLGYVKLFDWEKEIRVLIEPSNVVPDAIFCAWDTSFPNSQDWEEFFGGLLAMMENAANHFELGFDPLRERV